MSIYTRNMRQDATYWAPGGLDLDGQVSFDDPITVKCRWEDKNEMVRDTNGDEFVSTAQVFTAQAVERRGYLAKGDQTATADPRTLDDAHEIKQIGSIPNLRNTKELLTAWL